MAAFQRRRDRNQRTNGVDANTIKLSHVNFPRRLLNHIKIQILLIPRHIKRIICSHSFIQILIIIMTKPSIRLGDFNEQIGHDTENVARFLTAVFRSPHPRESVCILSTICIHTCSRSSHLWTVRVSPIAIKCTRHCKLHCQMSSRRPDLQPR